MNRREGGFTLVEMLVSLTLLAMAAALMATGLASARGLWARLEGTGRRGEQVEAAQNLLRDRIQRLSPVTRFEGGAPYADVNGDASELEFTALPFDSDRPAPMRRFRLELSDGDLVLESQEDQARPADADADAASARQVLLDGVAGLRIDYYGSDAPGGAPGWSETWSHAPAPPELVRIRVSFPDGDRRIWPTQIVRPAAIVDALCIIDPVTSGCRGRA
jgi:general secretion pathway protein J